MRTRRLWVFALAALLLTAFLLFTSAAVARFLSPIGVQSATAADPLDGPLALRIWYPRTPGFGDRIKGTALPLIVISHGTGGSALGHSDTARALARAGFIVVALTHAGDNYRDQSYAGRGLNLVRRPGQIAYAIDYMLASWPHHDVIDPQRIGMFGFSAGGFTTLVVAGGSPDLSRGAAHCRTQPGSWGCIYVRSHGWEPGAHPEGPQRPWIHDPRVKAAVVAAPAVGYSFEPDHLANVVIPIQLWGGDHDRIIDDSALIVRRLLPPQTEFHLVRSAGHFSFMAPCSWSGRAIVAIGERFGVPAVCRDPAGFDRRAFHAAFNDAVVAFFTAKLKRSGPV